MILSNSRTLLEDIQAAKEAGFPEEFIFREDKILARSSNKSYTAEECVLVEFCIHEGLSDPSDQSILFLIECTDGTKGCLSSSYGVYANVKLIEFVRGLTKKEDNKTP